MKILVGMSGGVDSTIAAYVLKKAKSHLDLLEMISLFDKDFKEKINLKYHDYINIEDSVEEKEKSISSNTNTTNIDIDKLFDFTYRYKNLCSIEGKTSVSSLSKDNQLINKEIQKPLFLQENTKLSKAEIGTITHLIMQKLDFSKTYNLEEINNLLNELVAKNIIDENEKNSINRDEIIAFTNSDLFKEIGKAKEIHKEQSFYMNIPANEIYDIPENNPVLIQGIIDLYYVNQNDEIVLLDYKTDNLQEGEERQLIEKYKRQLELYKEAIEESQDKKVTKTYIYSTKLRKAIQI